MYMCAFFLLSVEIQSDIVEIYKCPNANSECLTSKIQSVLECSCVKCKEMIQFPYPPIKKN